MLLLFFLQPGGGLRREKTVVEQAADMDDSEKQEIVGVLMREQTNLAMRLNREQTRQEEMVSSEVLPKIARDAICIHAKLESNKLSVLKPSFSCNFVDLHRTVSVYFQYIFHARRYVYTYMLQTLQ